MPKQGHKQSPKHIAKRSAGMVKACTTPEIFALIQRYERPLIRLLAIKYYGLNYRCNNPNDIGYSRYGGRGIENRFSSQLDFLNYVIFEMGVTTIEQIKGLTIDRINNDGNYEPGNIRFVSRKVNQNNRRCGKK